MVTAIPYARPFDDDIVTVTTTGNITKITATQHRNNTASIIPIDKDHYANARTGELFEFQRTEKRTDNTQALKRIITAGRDIINANTEHPECCLFVTLTYAENMQDTEKLHRDVANFTRDLRAHYGHFEYVTAVEPQARGAWHEHIIMIFPQKPPFIDENDVRQREWKNRGWVKIQSMQNCDNIGAYLSAYLCDIPTDDRGIPLESIDLSQPIPHKVQKGLRLCMYPRNMQIFRHSKGIKQPTKETMTYRKAKEKVGVSTQPTYSKALMIEGDNDFRNIVTTEYYNTLIAHNQEK